MLNQNTAARAGHQSAYDLPSIEERVALGDARSASPHAIVAAPTAWAFDDNIATYLSRRAANQASKLAEDGYSKKLYSYHDANGRWIFGVVRFDHPTKPKEIRPLRVEGVYGGIPRFEFLSLQAPRPLYGLDLLAARPSALVIVVEGEKAADAGRSKFPDAVVASWPGGAAGVATTDLRPLAGRSIVIWPDNDLGGLRAAENLGFALQKLGVANLRVVPIPPHFPQKWDIADPVPEELRD